MRTRKKDSLPIIFTLFMSIVLILSGFNTDVFAIEREGSDIVTTDTVNIDPAGQMDGSDSDAKADSEPEEAGSSISEGSTFIASIDELDDTVSQQFLQEDASAKDVFLPDTLNVTIETIGYTAGSETTDAADTAVVAEEIEEIPDDEGYYTLTDIEDEDSSSPAGVDSESIKDEASDSSNKPQMERFLDKNILTGIRWNIDPAKSSGRAFSSHSAGAYFTYVPEISSDYIVTCELPTITVYIVDADGNYTPVETSDIEEDQESADARKDWIEYDDGTYVFNESVYMSDVKISVSADEGVLPAGSMLSVTPATYMEEVTVSYAVKKEREADRNVAYAYTYDISILDADGNEIEPNIDRGNVDVTFKFKKVPDGSLNADVYHINESEEGTLIADRLETETVNERTLSAKTDGFSFYMVEFTYADGAINYPIQEGGDILLSVLLEKLGLNDKGTVTIAEAGEGDGEKITITPLEGGDKKITSNLSEGDSAVLKVTLNDETGGTGEQTYNINITTVVLKAAVKEGELSSIDEGESTILEAVISNSNNYTPTYQWYLKGATSSEDTELDGGTDAELLIDTSADDTPYTAGNTYKFYCKVTLVDKDNTEITQELTSGVVSVSVLAVRGYSIRVYYGTGKDDYVEYDGTISDELVYTFTGSKIKPKVKIIYTEDEKEKEYTEGKYYEVKYKENTNVAAADGDPHPTIVIKRLKDPIVNEEIPFAIEPATKEDITKKVTIGMHPVTGKFDLSDYLGDNGEVDSVVWDVEGIGENDIEITYPTTSVAWTSQKKYIGYKLLDVEDGDTGTLTIHVNDPNYIGSDDEEGYNIILNVTVKASKTAEAKLVKGNVSTEVTAVAAPLLTNYAKTLTDGDVNVVLTVTPKSESEAGTGKVSDNTIKSDFGTTSDIKKEYLDISVLKTVYTYEDGEAKTEATSVTDLGTVIEVALAYNMSGKYDTTVYRSHSGSVSKMTKLSARATSNYSDGSYFADTASNIVYIYSRYYSIYTLASSTKQTHTVTFDDGLGTSSSKKTVTVADGATVAKPTTTPTRTGYTFEGWFTSDGTEWDFTKPVTSDMTLTAKWKSTTATNSNSTTKTSTSADGSTSGSGSGVPKTGESLPPYGLWLMVMALGMALMIYGARSYRRASGS